MVGDQNRVGRDMIAIVEIVAGRLMRYALTREGHRLVTLLVGKIEGLPSGATGCHLEEGEIHLV